jgi:hypothetical protein
VAQELLAKDLPAATDHQGRTQAVVVVAQAEMVQV